MSVDKGRPKSDNPKSYVVKARVDAETFQKFSEYCEKHNTSISDVIRNYVKRVAKRK